MKTRLDLLDTIPKGGVCAELGVFAGEFSRDILARLQPSTLYLVDIFTGIDESGDVNGNNFKTIDLAAQFHTLTQQYKTVESVHVVQNHSVSFLMLWKDYFDFVYIDTSPHTYAKTIAELEAARIAVKAQGIISGHDYHVGHFPGVVQAVGEFCNRYNLAKELTEDDGLASYKIVNVK